MPTGLTSACNVRRGGPIWWLIVARVGWSRGDRVTGPQAIWPVLVRLGCG